MTLSTGGGLSSDINMTPMIDILLVLLIIFMAITPVTPKGLEALLPQPPRNDWSERPDDVIVLQILRTNTGRLAYKINKSDVQQEEILGRLQTIFSSRPTKVMFIQGAKDVDFSRIAEGIDVAKAAGVDRIGLITPKIAAGR
jgi:biopolymer transport protein ExbD